VRWAEVSRTAWFAAWVGWNLLRGRYDVYHVHGNYWFALVPAVLARLRRIPMVVKVTQLGDDDAETVARKRVGCLPVGWIYSLPLRTASVVVALNTEIARRHQMRFPLVPVVRVPNGVETERFLVTEKRRLRMRDELGVGHEGRIALFVGYITARKGVEELVEAWMQFVSARAADTVKDTLLLVGPDSGVYRYVSSDALRTAVSATAGEAGVRVLQHVPPATMPDLYACADVFVLPTRAEGMPNSLLEALAAGLPAVASRVPGVEEVLGADGDSVLVESVTATEIADALREMLGDRKPASAGSRVPRLPACFDMSEVASRYVRLYRALVDRSSGAAAAAFGRAPADWPE